MNYTNIPTGLKITSQIPLDVKGYALNEATLSYLGVDDNLAFTYHEGLRVVCIEERKVYEWREVQVGEENTGLVAVDFTYPSNLADVYGINYSDRVFNFFLVNQITPETLEDYVLQIDLPGYSCSDIGLNGGPNIDKWNVLPIYHSEQTSGANKIFKFATVGVLNDSPLTIEEYSYSEFGALRVINGIGFQAYLEDTSTIKLSGDISPSNPLTAKTLNPQKTINTFPYELLDTDDQHTLFVTNAGSNVQIRVPDTLSDNFTCVIIQEGTGTVTVTALGATVLNVPAGLTAVVKGQYHWAMLEKKGATTSHYLGGSLTPTP